MPQRISNDRQQHGSKQRWFCPEYSSDLLCAVQMEISVSEDDDPHNDSTARTVLYSAIDHRKTVCPSWHHLSDCIHHKDLTVQTYENMCATFQTVRSDDDDKDDPNTTSIICRVPLHPSKMYKISSHPPYDQLPLNCALVRYSDDSVRVQAAHYQLLSSHSKRHCQLNGSMALDNPLTAATTQQQKSPIASISGSTVRDHHAQLEDFRRFEDKSFRALDLVASPVRIRSASSASDASPSLLDESMKRLSIDELVSSPLNHNDECGNDRANLEYLAHETAALEWHLQLEEVVCQREAQELQRKHKTLRQLAEDIQQAQDQTAQVQRAIRTEQREIRKIEFRLDASRIRLVKELAFVYPITTATDDSYNNRRRLLIRGLEVPAVVSLLAVHEDEVAAALGMLAHTALLLGKYLDVHLRYRIHCHGSRSAIQDTDTATVYPLFPARAVDREQLEYAVHLLDRNIDCLMQSRGIGVAKSTHVLIKIKRIYEHVIEGY